MPRQGNRQIRSIVGGNIRAAREARGWTQARLSYELGGIGESAVSRWESGRVKPNDDNLLLIAHALGQSFIWFYTNHDEEVAA